jgi:hypothetical protein
LFLSQVRRIVDVVPLDHVESVSNQKGGIVSASTSTHASLAMHLGVSVQLSWIVIELHHGGTEGFVF